MPTYYVDVNSEGGTGLTNALTGTDAAFVDLATWDAARAGDVTGRGEPEVCIVGSNHETLHDPDESTVALAEDWETSETCYVDIHADAASYATSAWSDTKFRRKETISHPVILDISSYATEGHGCNYLRIHGLQFLMDVTNFTPGWRLQGISFSVASGTEGADVRFHHNHLRYAGVAAWSNNDTSSALHGIRCSPASSSANPWPRIYIYDNVIDNRITGTYRMQLSSRGIYCDHRRQYTYIHNNTIIGLDGQWNYHIGGDDGGERVHYAKNNLHVGPCNSAPYQAESYSDTSDYNATDQSSLGYTAQSHDHVSHTFTFVSADDFALDPDDTGAKDLGVANPDSLGMFTDDINLVTRGTPWDIGAAEAVDEEPAIQPLQVNIGEPLLGYSIF